MAFDKHTADLARYYRSVGNSPVRARELARYYSSTYVKPFKSENWGPTTYPQRRPKTGA